MSPISGAPLDAPLILAAQAAAQACVSGEADIDGLAPIEALLRSPKSSERTDGASLLAFLALDFLAARDVVTRVLHSRSATQRLAALMSVRPAHDPEFRDGSLRAALDDRAWKVRAYPSRLILRYRLSHLLPDLSSALSREKHATTKLVMEQYHALLEHGFHSKPGSGHVDFALDSPEGIHYRSVSARYVKACGPEHVARRLRQCVDAEQRIVRCTRALDPYWNELDPGERSAVLKLLRTVDPRDLYSADRERFLQRLRVGALIPHARSSSLLDKAADANLP